MVANVRGKAALRKVLADRFLVIPDMRWDPEYDHVYGNNAVSVWTVRGASEGRDRPELPRVRFVGVVRDSHSTKTRFGRSSGLTDVADECASGLHLTFEFAGEFPPGFGGCECAACALVSPSPSPPPIAAAWRR